jgi:transketolase
MLQYFNNHIDAIIDMNKISAQYKDLANCIRALSMDAVEYAKSGHPGMPMGMADVATILFAEFLNFNPVQPDWPNRDRLILSAGHGSMLLYSLLYLTGYKEMTLDQLKSFRTLHSKTPGHPEYKHTEGIETSTGPLGQGLANAVGIAFAEKIQASNLGNNIIDHYTYVIAGDGCLMEGISHEAISFAGNLQLNKLIVLFDDNSITIDGDKNLADSEDQLMRFKAAGWYVQQIDGHNHMQISQALQNAKASKTPSMIACKTIIAYGAPTKAGSEKAHGSPLGSNEIQSVKESYGWDKIEPFYIPQKLLDVWRNVGKKSHSIYDNWLELSRKLSTDKQKILKNLSNKQYIPNGLASTIKQAKKEAFNNSPNEATRKSSLKALEHLTKEIPELIGGSADLTESNLTKTNSTMPITKNDFSGRYIYYGIREHAMAAIMNGLTIYGGIIPYGGTFLVFSDYARPAIRLSALMGLRVIYVLTHDSIGLGEDGPTHQPIEHLASLRAIPNLQVMRPADASETIECWDIAIKSTQTPSILALTRQNLPSIRSSYTEENLASKGGYVVSEFNQDLDLDVTIFATGSEVSIAIEAQKNLEQQNIGTRVVSMPCMELFDKQSSEYITNILCNKSIKVAIEAAVSFGWDKYIGPHGIFIGMNSFGASAPASKLFDYFGINADNVVKQITEKIKSRNGYQDGKNSN